MEASKGFSVASVGSAQQAPKSVGRRLPPVGRPWALEDAAPRCESELHFMVAMNTGSEQR